MDMYAHMQTLLDEIEAELPTMKWSMEIVGDQGMQHYSGVGARWTASLLVTGDQVMAAASSGAAMAIVKLPQELVLKAEASAKAQCST